MKKVREVKTDLSKLNHLLAKVDFEDTFATTNHVDSMERIVKRILNEKPKWIDALIAFRNRIVKRFGLQTTIPDDYHTQYVVGGYVSFFKIFAIEKNRVILGADDTHLNFKVAIVNDESEQFNIKVTTLVEFNNTFGKVYMSIIKPFHKIVLINMVKKAFR
jgi:hypothetical protein